MSSNLSVVIGADTSKFTKAVVDAKNKLSQWTSEAKSAASSSEEVVNVTEAQAEAYSRVLKTLEKISSGSLNTAQSQKVLSQQITELRTQWQSLTDVQKNSDFGRTLSQTLGAAQSKLAEIKDNAKAAGASLASMGGGGELPLKKQLKMLSAELVSLTNTYRNMSEEEKASAAGRKLEAKMDKIRAKAGELRDTIGDVSSEISVMASDTPNLDAFNQLLGVGTSIMTTYSGVVAKLAGDEYALRDMIATVTMVQGAANTMTKLTNALQSSSAVMLKARAIQEKAAAAAIAIKAAAEGKGTIATKAATAAQAAFNVVAKANPYVLLATAVVAVGAALYGLTKHLNDNKAAEEAATKAAERHNEALKFKEESMKNANNQYADTIAKIRLLVIAASNENLQLNERKKACEELNRYEPKIQANINRTTGAFSYQAGALQSLLGKLKNYYMMLAAEDYLKSLYRKKIELEGKLRMEQDNQKFQGAQKDAWKKIYDDKSKAETKQNSTRAVGWGAPSSAYYSSPDVKKASDNFKIWGDRTSKTGENIKGLTQDLASLNKEIEINEKTVSRLQSENKGFTPPKIEPATSRSSRSGSGSSKSSVSSSDVKALEGSLEAANKEYKDFEDNLAKGLFNGKKIAGKESEYIEEIRAKREELQQKIKGLKIALGLELEVEEGSIAALEDAIAKKKVKLELTADPESQRQLAIEIEELDLQKLNIEIGLEQDPIEKSKKTIDLLTRQRQLYINTVVDINSEEAKAKLKQFDEDISKEVKNLNFLELDAIPTDLGKLEAELKDLEDIRLEIKVDDKDSDVKLKQVNKRIAETNNKITELKIKYNTSEIGKVEAELDYLNELQLHLDIDDKDFASKLQEILKQKEIKTKELEALKVKYGIEPYFPPGSIGALRKTLQDKISDTEIKIDASVQGSEEWKKLVEQLKEYQEKLDELGETEPSNPLQKFLGETGDAISTLINDMSTLAGSIGDLTGNDAFASIAQSALKTIPAVLSLVGAISALAVANGIKSAKNWVEAIAAAVALSATVISTIAAVKNSTKKYAGGGIVSGASKIGDYNIARVNDGEVILNQRQQAHLWNMLNSNNSTNRGSMIGTPKVEFKIKGKELVGVLSNYNKQQNRI